MKKTKRKTVLYALLCSIIAMFTLGACTVPYMEVQVEEDTTTDRIEYNEETEACETTQELQVPNEPFTLIANYDTGKYDIQNWHVTEDKSVTMSLITKDLPEGYEVYVEHMHADVILKSTSQQINGILQDSMDDYSHIQPSDGFYIDNELSYTNIFCIEGYNETFYELWGHCFGTYGTVSTNYQKLTETNIINVGTYAEKLHVIYDIRIKRPDSEHFYQTSVESEILIPVSQTSNTVTVQKKLEF